MVSYSIDWKGPAHFDDVLAVRVKPKKIGNTSYSLQVDFYNHDNKKMIASAQIVYVMVSVDEHEKMIIPEVMRKQLEGGAQGVRVNHAGV